MMFTMGNTNPNRLANELKSQHILGLVSNESQQSSPPETMNGRRQQRPQNQPWQGQSPHKNLSILDKEVDGLLSNEMLKLSFVDRNAINEEIHGVRSLAVEETPQMINNALHTFRLELESFPPSQKQAYLFIQANRQCNIQRYHQQTQQHQHIDSYVAMGNTTAMPTPTYAAYTEDDNFRLRFLRCCLFDVKKAVMRFANYLNLIQTYWGDSYLSRPIQLSDFSPAEMKYLKKGFYQFLPFRDRKGRRVIVSVGGNLSDLNDITALKIWFYVFDCATRDSVESQRNGIVSLIDGDRLKEKFNDSVCNKLFNMLNSPNSNSHIIPFHHSLPSRIVCIHICWPYSPMLRLLSNLLMFQSKTLFLRYGTFGSSALELSRIKFHRGTATEMRYIVKSHGIPVELLPLTGSNTIKLNCHNQWIRTRRLIEGNNTESVTIVESPCSNDVVFRNGTQSMDNPGNSMFRNSILTYWEEEGNNKGFSNAAFSATVTPPSNQKKAFAGTNNSSNYEHPSPSGDTYNREFREQLVRDIEVHKKGRFLEWDKDLGVWVQIRDKVRIHRKVAMAFYNCTKRRYNNRSASTATVYPSKRRRGGTTTTSRHQGSRHRGSLQSFRADLTTSNTALAYQFIDKDNGGCCFPVPSSTNGNDQRFDSSTDGNGNGAKNK